MSETKWTPGPWLTADGHGPIEGGTSIQAAGDNWLVAVTTGYYGREVTQANARLISAAPELYSALEALVQRATDELADREDVHEVSMARDALAKARGEQP